MPAPVVAAGIAAGGSLLGGVLQSRSQGKAIDAQERANQEALQFQREQEEQRRIEWEQQQAALRAQWEAREARLAPFRQAAAAVLGNWGYDVPSYTPTTMPEGWAPGMAEPAAMSRPLTLGDLAGISTSQVPPVAAPLQAPQPMTLGSLFGPQVGRPRGEMGVM